MMCHLTLIMTFEGVANEENKAARLNLSQSYISKIDMFQYISYKQSVTKKERLATLHIK